MCTWKSDLHTEITVFTSVKSASATGSKATGYALFGMRWKPRLNGHKRNSGKGKHEMLTTDWSALGTCWFSRSLAADCCRDWNSLCGLIRKQFGHFSVAPRLPDLSREEIKLIVSASRTLKRLLSETPIECDYKWPADAFLCPQDLFEPVSHECNCYTAFLPIRFSVYLGKCCAINILI